MLFNSAEYIIFYVLFFAIFFMLRTIGQQIWFIGLASLYFYASWSPIHVVLLLTTCGVAYISQKPKLFQLSKWVENHRISISVTILLLILTFFKYANFFLDLLAGLGGPQLIVDILLPVGISFYVFQAISFVVDHERGHIPPIKFTSVLGYIAFFPQLVAGPIVRASVFLPQLESKRRFNSYMVKTGLLLFAMGMFKKIVIADNLAVFVDEIYDNAGETTSANHWLAFYLYALQIYYDFCGYSEMAIGIARTLGFKFPKNFNQPYLSKSITEFWRRWHISLSSWLRDYLYISLGGNRYGAWKTYRNLAAVMLFGGLWHGASWTFVVWGAFHGAMLAVERFYNYSPEKKKWTAWLGIFVTFHLVCISWVPFRAPDFTTALAFFGGMFDWSTITTITTKFTVLKCILMVALFFVIERYTNLRTFLRLRRAPQLIAVGVVYAVIMLLFGRFTDSPFIYFQF